MRKPPFLLATLVGVATALPLPHRIELQLRQQLHSQENDAPPPPDDSSTSDVETLYFDQGLDHFSDEGEIRTFRQRYFYTPRYVHPKEEGSQVDNNIHDRTVAFLCVGGEGPSMDATVLTNSVHCTGDMIGLADKLFHEFGWDIHLFAIEHRYYGESFPSQKNEAALNLVEDDSSNSETEDSELDVDFTFLSSRQAVRDIVEFVKSPEALKRMDILSPDSKAAVKWVTFGGSYPGMLSAWSRLLHPDDIYGAVSNSAPVQAELDFSQYNDHVGLDLEDEIVGGSRECRRIVEEGHVEFVAILKGGVVHTDGEEDGFERLGTLFNICDGADALRADRRNGESFVGDGLIYIPAQENDPSCEGGICNIKGLCDTIVNEHKSSPDKSSMEILAQVRKMQSTGCTNIYYDAYIDYISTPTPVIANFRSWLYQTCTEFGFYQTCLVHSKCPYGRGYHNVSVDLEVCNVVFGIEPETVKNSVQSTLNHYGGKDLTPRTQEQKYARSGNKNMLRSGTGASGELQGQKRIIFVNGDVDPWEELSVTKAWGNKDHPSIIVPGASHHYWTHEKKPTDSDEITRARQTIYDTVSMWLGVSANSIMNQRGEVVSVDQASF